MGSSHLNQETSTTLKKYSVFPQARDGHSNIPSTNINPQCNTTKSADKFNKICRLQMSLLK